MNKSILLFITGILFCLAAVVAGFRKANDLGMGVAGN
jgi:hypothetical protein